MQDPLGIVVMKLQTPTAARSAPLKAIKAAHTIVWAFFAACILAIPFASWRGEHRVAAWFAAIVFFEVAVLVLNRWRCPLTSVAARTPPTGVAAWREIQASVAGNGVTALAAAGLRWGPLCVLALLGPAVWMAEFAVAARTAQIVDS
jgi:hypothetical protein